MMLASPCGREELEAEQAEISSTNAAVVSLCRARRIRYHQMGQARLLSCDIVKRLTLEEKVQQMKDVAPAIDRLGADVLVARRRREVVRLLERQHTPLGSGA